MLPTSRLFYDLLTRTFSAKIRRMDLSKNSSPPVGGTSSDPLKLLYEGLRGPFQMGVRRRAKRRKTLLRPGKI
jgi:hypothetical protein